MNKMTFVVVLCLKLKSYDKLNLIYSFNFILFMWIHSVIDEQLTSSSIYFWTDFRKKVRSLSTNWISMNKYWLTKSKLPTHVIVYERQLSQTVLEMYQLMKFLDLPVKAKSLLCISKFTVERRKKPDWLKPSNLYDEELQRVVNKAINEVAESIGIETETGKLIQNYLFN